MNFLLADLQVAKLARKPFWKGKKTRERIKRKSEKRTIQSQDRDWGGVKIQTHIGARERARDRLEGEVKWDS